MRPELRETDPFGNAERARLWYKVSDLLPDSINYEARLDAGGMKVLEDLLKRNLGKFDLRPGATAWQRIQAFITTAPQQELLELIRLIPIARLSAHRSYCQMGPVPYYEDDRVVSEASGELNVYLETTTSPARFNQQGMLQLDPFAPDAPVALAKLPKREQLEIDLGNKCAEEPPTSLVFVDLDHFKQVNDTLGHQIGNECLIAVANILGSIAAMRGKAYRYGGDEFVIVLPNCTTAEAAPIAERVRKEVDQANVGGTVKVTTSIGVAGTETVGKNAGDLIAKADQAMYKSKNSGKNRVTQAE